MWFHIFGTFCFLSIVFEIVVCLDNLTVNTVDYLKSKCRVDPAIDSPSDITGIPTNVTAVFIPKRFLGIDDVHEVFTVSATLLLIWTDDCVEEALLSDDFHQPNKHQFLSFFFNPKSMWHPRATHGNSRSQGPLDQGKFEIAFRYETKLKEFGAFFYGVYESICNLNFWLFPFDSQQCHVELLIYPGYPHIVVNETKVEYDGDWLPENSNWNFISSSTGKKHPDPSTHEDSHLLFFLNFKRKPDYFTLNLFTPGIILVILELSSFAIPPDKPDRATFAATIMLTMFVLHSQVLSYLPKTPQPILAAYYFIGEIVFGTFCTVYSAFICWMVNYKQMANKTIRIFNYKSKFYRFVDTSVFIFSMLLFGIYNAVIFFLGKSNAKPP